MKNNKTDSLACALIRTNGKIELLRCKTLEDMQKAVGGYIEVVARVGFNERFAVVLGDEEAKLKETPINMCGTLWLNSHGFKQVVHGDLVLVGQVPKDDDFVDCPNEAVSELPDLWEEPRIVCVSSSEEKSIAELFQILNAIVDCEDEDMIEDEDEDEEIWIEEESD